MEIKQHTNKWFKKEVRREITKYLETNENENKTYKHLWEVVKAVKIGKFIKYKI